MIATAPRRFNESRTQMRKVSLTIRSRFLHAIGTWKVHHAIDFFSPQNTLFCTTCMYVFVQYIHSHHVNIKDILYYECCLPLQPIGFSSIAVTERSSKPFFYYPPSISTLVLHRIVLYYQACLYALTFKEALVRSDAGRKTASCLMSEIRVICWIAGDPQIPRTAFGIIRWSCGVHAWCSRKASATGNLQH